jgi:hypothetical protein
MRLGMSRVGLGSRGVRHRRWQRWWSTSVELRQIRRLHAKKTQPLAQSLDDLVLVAAGLAGASVSVDPQKRRRRHLPPVQRVVVDVLGGQWLVTAL